MKKRRRRRNDWKNYAAATAGLVGTAVGMEAKVTRADLFQPVEPDITISPGQTIFVDFNQDGGGPFAGTSPVPDADMFLSFFPSFIDAFAGFYLTSPGQFLETVPDKLRKLGELESIGPGSSTWGSNLNSFFESGSDTSYQWEGGGTGFIGARLVNGAGHNYGWLQVTFDDDADTLTLHAFAINEIVDGSITTIPEAQSLAACSLALGGVLGAQGIAAYRRRKKELATA